MEKVHCSNPKCRRLAASAARHPEGLCFGCAYLGQVTVNKILKRATATKERIERTNVPHKSQRRRQGFRKGARA